MIEWIVATCVVLGGAIMLLGAIGVVRMPDLFTRMQAATKPGILGSSMLALAASIHFADIWVVLRALLIAGFFFLTAPIAAHVIARAAYGAGVKLWEGSVRDDLRHRYTRRGEHPKSTDA